MKKINNLELDYDQKNILKTILEILIISHKEFFELLDSKKI